MVIINGFKQAQSLLSRQPLDELRGLPSGVKARLKELFGTDEPQDAVRQIIAGVRQRKDEALFDYARKIDGVKLDTLTVDKRQISDAYHEVDEALLSALKLADDRIRTFHQAQKEAMWGGAARRDLRQLVRPLERVGIYAPGGSAGYPSTVLMSAIPARVAGVKEIILVTPPKTDGKIPPATLVAADIAGVERILAVGGAQAIAALAYGTQSVPRVDKICGPGNIFVMLAKRQVYGVVDIDGLAGPSEVVIIADDKANIAYCAADILAQLEHDVMASAILITTSPRLADEVSREVEQKLADLPDPAVAGEALENGGKIVVVASMAEAIELSNLYAPEHLCLMVEDAASYVGQVASAGCVFIGGDSSVVLGDYVAGPSHVLPTGGTARFGSPLSVASFLKLINCVSVDKAELADLSRAAAALARAEGFEAHARAAEIRLNPD
ncbi:histidinol dehydrogenase [Chloroflexota bacterium]